jgi:hypothetical protein
MKKKTNKKKEGWRMTKNRDREKENKKTKCNGKRKNGIREWKNGRKNGAWRKREKV